MAEEPQTQQQPPTPEDLEAAAAHEPTAGPPSEQAYQKPEAAQETDYLTPDKINLDTTRLADSKRESSS